MFRHKGKARTLKHNLGVASLLSFVAGMVNVAGFIAVQRLTTNVTGHFAFVVEEILKLNFSESAIYFLYIFFFFAGSFTSGFMVEFFTKKNENVTYTAPVVFEAVLILISALFGQYFVDYNPNLLAFLLLFAMGLQNSLVTTISSATVRTTHLTGLFTDLGIELSQLFFYKQAEQRGKLYSSIQLRVTIISFFFLGGLAGGLLYTQMHLHVLVIAAAILIGGITYDDIKLRLILGNRN